MSTRSVRHRRDRRRRPPRHGGARAHGGHHGPPRPGRTGDLVRRAGGPRVPPARDHRPARALEPADALRRPGTSSSTARSTTTASCATSCAGLGHAFVTEGDGEVLLHAWAEWGERALDRLNGMFAFAVWDDERRELVLRLRPVRREAALLGARRRAARLRLGRPGAAAVARPRPAARRDSTRSAAYLGRGADAADRPRPSSPASSGCRARTCCAGRTGASRCAATGARAASTFPSRYEDAVERLREPARRLDPPAPAQRRARRHVAQRRHRLLGGRHAQSASSPATTAATRSRRASRATSATSGATPTRSPRAAGVVEHHAVEPTAAEAARRPRRARPRPGGARRLARASTRSGASCGPPARRA